MTDFDIVFIAGLFEARGYAWCSHPKASKNGKRYNRLTVKITQGERDVLDWVTQTIGYGRVYPKGGKTNDWDLKLSYNQAKEFLQLILPHLRTRADEVREVLIETYGRTEAGVA